MDTKLLRRRFYLTQEELSRRYGIPLSTIRNWDCRKCAPDYVINIIRHNLELEELVQRLKN